MRGFFALCVALGHLFDIAQLNTGYDGVLAVIRPCFGFQWVVGFFVVSGFCIESSVLHARDKSARHYGLLRLTRLAPAYFAILALALAVEVAVFSSPFRPPVWQAVSAPNFGAQMILLQGSALFGVTAFGCYASTYTITHEVIYYALWAGRVRFFQHVSALPLLIMAALIAYVSSRLLSRVPGAGAIAIIMQFGLLWLLGVAARRAWNDGRLVGYRMYWLAIPALSVAVIPYVFGDPGRNWFYVLGALFAIALLAPYPALMNAHWGRWATHAGQISYPLFLVHGVVGIGLGTIFNYIGGVSFVAQFTALIVGSLAAAWGVVVLLERPLLLYRRKRLGGFSHDSDAKPLDGSIGLRAPQPQLSGNQAVIG